MSRATSFAMAAYPSKEDAETALDRLESIAREKIVKLKDAAIAVRTEDGIELHQRHQLSAGGGAVAGGTVGLVAGFFVGVPIAAAVAGMAIGGALGFVDRGIDDARMRSLAASLEPGQAALCVLIQDADWPRLRERVEPLGGELIVAELTPEAAEALARAVAEEGKGPAS
jgi:uncharacterized membrane protein